MIRATETQEAIVQNDSGEAPSLGVVLNRLARVAQLYSEGALGFTCDEVIRYRRVGQRSGRVRYRYIYVREDGELKDYRVSTALGRRKDRDDKINYPGPAILLRPYSWIFSFGSNNQKLNTYRFLGREQVLGRAAAKLWVEPVDFERIVADKNEWVGTFWVDLATYQLIKVDAYHVDEYRNLLSLKEAFRNAAASDVEVEPSEHTVERITTLFATEKEGFRYPSEAVLERRRYQVPYDKALNEGREDYLVRQEYSNYQLYTTRTSREFLQQVLNP